MTQEGAYLFAVVCEAAGDRRVTTGLVDRVLCRDVDWIEPESLDHHRQWRGLEEGTGHLEWHEIRRLARERGLKAHGHFRGEPGALDAQAARLALLLLMTASRRPDAVVLVRDTDGEEERRAGLEQARSDRPWPFGIAIGLAHLDRESWVLAGFEPEDETERQLLAEISGELGFDPRLRPLRLQAGPGEPRNAKGILQRLVRGRSEREEACWTACDLEVLRSRGSATGLADFLQEVEERIVPLFGGPLKP